MQLSFLEKWEQLFKHYGMHIKRFNRNVSNQVLILFHTISRYYFVVNMKYLNVSYKLNHKMIYLKSHGGCKRYLFIYKTFITTKMWWNIFRWKFIIRNILQYNKLVHVILSFLFSKKFCNIYYTCGIHRSVTNKLHDYHCKTIYKIFWYNNTRFTR